MYTEDLGELPDEEDDVLPTHNQEHTRSTFTYEETRLLKFVRYTKFSSIFWLVYLIPATFALLVALFFDRVLEESCDKYLFVWAVCQTFLQICNILIKASTLFVLSRLPSSPEPSEIELYTDSKPFLITAWLNRVVYILWIGWFSCGTLWVFEALLGSSECHLGLLFDVILALVVLQLLLLAGATFLCCCSSCVLCIRILQVLIRISRERENGIAGLIQMGASKEVIQTHTTSKTFSSDLMEETNAMCAICLEDYAEGEKIRYLPCSDLHHFHVSCVDQWLENRKCCPLCKVNIDRESSEEEIEPMV